MVGHPSAARTAKGSSIVDQARSRCARAHVRDQKYIVVFAEDPKPGHAFSLGRALIPAPNTSLFVENVGQFDPGVLFQAVGPFGTLHVAEDCVWLTVLARTNQTGADMPYPSRESLLDDKGDAVCTGVSLRGR